MTLKAFILIEVFMFCLLLFLGGTDIKQSDRMSTQTVTTFIPDTTQEQKQTIEVKFNYFIRGLLGNDLPDTTQK